VENMVRKNFGGPCYRWEDNIKMMLNGLYVECLWL